MTNRRAGEAAFQDIAGAQPVGIGIVALDETGQCETGLSQMEIAEDSGLKGVCFVVRS